MVSCCVCYVVCCRVAMFVFHLECRVLVFLSAFSDSRAVFVACMLLACCSVCLFCLQVVCVSAVSVSLYVCVVFVLLLC